MRYLILSCALLFTARSVQADVVVRNGDVFEVRLSGASVEYLQEFVNLIVTVDDGMISVPIIGRVRAAGLTSSQIAASIEKQYRDQKIFTNPSVAINVQITVRQVIVGGAVRGPGRQQWTSELTLTSAIGSAGGRGEWATKWVKVNRGGKIERINLDTIKKDPTLDIKLQPGDYIEVEGDF